MIASFLSYIVIKISLQCRLFLKTEDYILRWISELAAAAAAAAAAKSLQSCPTLCNPIDGSPSGSPVPGILQARTLEWVAISFSNARKWKVKGKLLSVSDPQQPRGLQPSRLLCPWDFPGKSTGVGCHCLHRLSHLGSPIYFMLLLLLSRFSRVRLCATP